MLRRDAANERLQKISPAARLGEASEMECRLLIQAGYRPGDGHELQDDTMTSGLSGPRPCHGFRQVRWLNGTMRKHRSRQRRNRPLQVLLHLITAVTAFSARSKEMAIMAAALS
jgi:hypothetical protein